ncbi:hypothetical protein A2U01_0071994 [Trifolium medium]|uniref:Uncharacterized protein n=1 Tax=Trifolium medium TaxID=97028 RepID=A0A392SS50_9FABA|nr:hypothetical protein [Trifolium medium]
MYLSAMEENDDGGGWSWRKMMVIVAGDGGR